MASTRFTLAAMLLVNNITTYSPAAITKDRNDHALILLQGQQKNNIAPASLFTRAEADRIVGTQTHITDSVYKTDEKSSSYLCGYQAGIKDEKTGKTGIVYFLFEDYKNVADAKARYSDVYESNKSHGLSALSGLGDEALYHTDGQNFDLIMVRKGRYVFNIKVNKKTSTTSFQELRKTVDQITKRI